MHDILAPHVYPRPVPFCVFFDGFLFLFMFWRKWKRHGILYLCPIIEAVWLIILSDLPASLNWNARYCKFIHPFLFPFLNSVLIHKLYPKDLNTFAQQGFGKSEISFDSDSKSDNFLAFYTQKCHAFYMFSHNHINIITKKYQSFFRSPAVN